MRNSRQLRMVRKLDAALAQRRAQRRARAEEIQRLIKSLPTNPDGTFMLPRNEAESAAHTRLMIAQAGLPLVDSLRDLTREQTHQYMKFHDIDPERDYLEYPCWSWEVPEGASTECRRLLGQRNRGEITPQEHRRRVREACGLPPEEPAASEDGGGRGNAEQAKNG